MPFKSFLLAATLLLLIQTLEAQRDLSYVADINSTNYTVKFNGRVLLFGMWDSHLVAFSDERGVSTYSYPLMGGRRLRYPSQRPPALYNGQVYFALSNDTTLFLYRFNGSSLTSITVPGTLVSNPVTYGAYLYVLSQSGSTIQLYRYNGTSFSPVSGGSIPEGITHRLEVAGSYLYLIGDGHYGTQETFIKRYNGVSFATISPIDDDVDKIYAVGNTAYFLVGGGLKLLYYDGATTSTIFDEPWTISSAAIWRGDLYFLHTFIDEPVNEPLYRAHGGVVSAIPMPADSKLYPYSHVTEYNDAIYLVATYGDSDNRALRYDGAGFTDFFNIPRPEYNAGTLYERDGGFIIQPTIVNGRYAYAEEDSVFTEIRAREGDLITKWLSSTACNHLWLILYYDRRDKVNPHRWALMKESKGCEPPDTPVLVIPRHFAQFEKFEFDPFARDRGWCWSDIVIDWHIPPCQFPDCPDPLYSVSMYDKSGKLAWQTKIDKPALLGIPLKDDQPYSARFTDIGTQQDLLLFDENLVEKGIESISLSMKPGENFFNIVAKTDKGVNVPLKVELLGGKGEVLWTKEFLAPFDEQITDKVKTPGQKLRFSVPDIEKKSIITGLDVYPNPSKGLINLQVQSDNAFTEAQLSITTLLGQKILDRKIAIPFNQQVRLNGIRPGMYVLKLVTGKEVTSRIIKVE